MNRFIILSFKLLLWASISSPFIKQLYTEVLFYFSALFSFSKNVIFLSSVTVRTLGVPQNSYVEGGLTRVGEMMGPLGDEM